MSKVDAPMDSHFTTFQTSINASIPDEVNNYSTSTEADVHEICTTPHDLALHISAPTDAYDHLLTSYLEFFQPEFRQMPTVLTKHGIYHHIKTMGPPVFTRFRHLTLDNLAAAKQTFAEMEEKSLYRKASRPWSLPLHIVLKKDSSLHLYGDYRRLYMMTEPDH
ncbi:uncharacterized protein [Palaemon carinicauda]|uniref:uncharacterized protein n=1 Tax=Palaemon carinicauda TaxID=392227 RepID=UPI0035B58254